MILQSDLQNEDYGIVSISTIEISPDGSKAWVTINTTASMKDKLEMVDVLNANAGLIRTELARVLQIRMKKAEENIEKSIPSFSFATKRASVETAPKRTSQKASNRVMDKLQNVKVPKSSRNHKPS